MKKIILLLAVFVCFSSIVLAVEDPFLSQSVVIENPFDFKYNIEPTINAWYPIPDNEKVMCQRWGGTPTPQNDITGDEHFQSDVTITLQAQKSQVGNQTLYEVGYYVEAFLNKVEFKVELKNKNGDKSDPPLQEIVNLEPHTAKADYKAIYDTKEWNEAVLTYTEEGITQKKLTVKIVNKK